MNPEKAGPLRSVKDVVDHGAGHRTWHLECGHKLGKKASVPVPTRAHCSACRVQIDQKYRTVRTCRVCGCTNLDCSGCIERTGEPCHWIEADLCSACEGKG